MGYKIIYTEQASHDLQILSEYLSETLSREIAERVRRRILDKIDTLASLPERAAPCLIEPWHSYGWRKLIAAKHYTVFLTIDNAAARVYIARIFFSGMDIDTELTQDEEK